jgi:hypothetical protein
MSVLVFSFLFLSSCVVTAGEFFDDVGIIAGFFWFDPSGLISKQDRPDLVMSA